MKSLVALGLLADSITLTPGAAGAQERTGDAALGALAGAVVAGPFGLVAGGGVGYTAGPGLARGGGRRHRSSRHPDRDVSGPAAATAASAARVCALGQRPAAAERLRFYPGALAAPPAAW